MTYLYLTHPYLSMLAVLVLLLCTPIAVGWAILLAASGDMPSPDACEDWLGAAPHTEVPGMDALETAPTRNASAPRLSRVTAAHFAFLASLDANESHMSTPGPTADRDGWETLRPTDAHALPPEHDPLRVVGLPAADLAPLPVKTPGQVFFEAAYPHGCGGWDTVLPSERAHFERGAAAIVATLQTAPKNL